MSGGGWLQPGQGGPIGGRAQMLLDQARRTQPARDRAEVEGLLDGLRSITAEVREDADRLQVANLKRDMARVQRELARDLEEIRSSGLRKWAPVSLQTRATAAASDGTSTISGYASRWNELDSYRDTIVKGAFRDSLAKWRSKGRLPSMFWTHDMSRVCGVWTSMTEDDVGLRVEGKLALKTQGGAEAYELLKMNAVTGLSIGYRVALDGSSFDASTRVTKLTAIDLMEVSVVALPAQDSARIDSVKDLSAVDTLTRLLAAARKLNAPTR